MHVIYGECALSQTREGLMEAGEAGRREGRLSSQGESGRSQRAGAPEGKGVREREREEGTQTRAGGGKGKKRGHSPVLMVPCCSRLSGQDQESWPAPGPSPGTMWVKV